MLPGLLKLVIFDELGRNESIVLPRTISTSAVVEPINKDAAANKSQGWLLGLTAFE